MPDVPGAGTTGAGIRAVESFLFREADLLDDRRFEAWLDLYTDDATYWIPLEHGQDNPHETASLIYDDRMAMELRVRQLSIPSRHAQMPKTWTNHLIGNVFISDVDRGGVLTVKSSCQVIEARGNTQRILGGRCTHRLVPKGDAFLIAAKRFDLVNCDAPHDGLNLPI